ncbi:MAG: polysaccharide deacetylase family protein [Pseudomonadota bacterium]|nr:polysaccharide deacetylase family protein [Pseudomonadota bacterium]
MFDTLLMACGIRTSYGDSPPTSGVWICYASSQEPEAGTDRCIRIEHEPAAWVFFEGDTDVETAREVEGLAIVLSRTGSLCPDPCRIAFDLVANAFYFLTSWSERRASRDESSRQLHAASVYARLGVPQDIVDRYVERLSAAIGKVWNGQFQSAQAAARWPGGGTFAVALSHDVDFLPVHPLDNATQAAKSVLRHLVRQRNPGDAIQAGFGFAKAILTGRDPYGCVPEIIAQECARGVRSSFQVAVARRHPADVNYDVRDDRTADYLRAITRAGFDLCLHGSYRSTERREWYMEEVEVLAERLGRPLGSRQHFLSFNYDTLFAAQEEAGIQYDMSIGFPDHPGPRAGFSFPYFPFDLERNRPFDVVETSLFYMDVTLQSYLRLTPGAALRVLDAGLDDLACKGGAVSVVWHPIVFAGARDPGYEDVYWHLVEHVRELGGVATDGRTINEHWRRLARDYASFARQR